ncbi:MAG: hypothetical protein J6F31_10350 [Oscillospiraceae bacterium]|nr:hypothetical protein [Oscillospiraceae bacterium]
MAVSANVARYEEFEEHRRIREEAHPKMVVIRRSQAPTAILSILVILVGTVFLALCLQSKAEIASIHDRIVSANAELNTLKQENSRMKTAIEEKSSQKAVEEYAENVLGMQKLERSQTEYITIDSGNVVEVSRKNESVFSKLESELERIKESLMDKQSEKQAAK